MRVVSLVPSATETLVAWGVDVVGCTRFCEQPHLVHVGGTKDPDIAAIVALAPDVVVMDREENRRPDAEALEAAGLRVHAMHIAALGDVAPQLDALAEVVGAVQPVGADRVGEATSPWVRAFVPIWRRPWMTIGAATYGSSVLAHIGVVNVFANAATAYPHVELTDVAALAPQVVLLPSEPYPFAERHLAELAEVLPGARLAFIDGQDLFWWGARTPGALVRLRAALHGVMSPG